jgi:hypothetical protein
MKAANPATPASDLHFVQNGSALLSRIELQREVSQQSALSVPKSDR